MSSSFLFVHFCNYGRKGCSKYNFYDNQKCRKSFKKKLLLEKNFCRANRRRNLQAFLRKGGESTEEEELEKMTPELIFI